jgi:serine/threonine protein kinase
MPFIYRQAMLISSKVIFCKKFDVRKRRGKYAKKCLFREYRTLQKLDHPFIVSYLGYEEDLKQNTASLYMEFCEGGDLETRHVLKRSDDDDSDDDDSDDAFSDTSASHPIPLQADEVWSIVFQLAAAMAYLHHGLSMKDNAFSFERHWRSVVHRDIKPANGEYNV